MISFNGANMQLCIKNFGITLFFNAVRMIESSSLISKIRQPNESSSEYIR